MNPETTTLQHLQEAVAALKQRAVIGGLCNRVRRIDESDEETIKRVVFEYIELHGILYRLATAEERSRLDDRRAGDPVALLKTILAEDPLTLTARRAATEE